MRPSHIIRTLLVFVSVLAIMIVAKGSAQPWIVTEDKSTSMNFYATQKAFYEYWAGRDTTARGIGWKPFKRWEWFWKPRVYPSGQFPNPMQLYNATVLRARGVQQQSSNARLTPFSNWTALGPTVSPGDIRGLGRVNCVRVDPSNSSILWVGTASGGVWRSSDAGVSWSTTTDELPTLSVSDIAIQHSNPAIMYLATGDADGRAMYSVGVLKSTNSGATWNTTGLNWPTSEVTLLGRLLLSPENDQQLLAAGQSGIYLTVNGGSSWKLVKSGYFRDMEYKPGNGNVVYAGTDYSGEIYRSMNAGANWTKLTSGLPIRPGVEACRVAIGVSPADSNYVYALYGAASFAGLYRSTDGGNTWSLRSSTPNILGYADDGSSPGGQSSYDMCMAISETDPNVIFTGGINLWKSIDGGATWARLTSSSSFPVHVDQHDIYIVSGTNVLYSANDGGLYRSMDSGISWSWIGNGLQITQFYRLGLSLIDSSFIIGGCQDNGTKIRDANQWKEVAGGDGMECLVDYSNSNIVYASTQFGALKRSTNRGSTWTGINSGIDERGAWTAPFVINPLNPQTLYVGLKNVWKSTNRGTLWSKISNFPAEDLSILAVAPSDSNCIYAGTGYTLLRTTDGGAAWTSTAPSAPYQYMTGVAIHSSDPAKIWVTYSGYGEGNKVFASTNGGGDWTNVSGSLPNVPVNCIVYQHNTADRIFVGTDIGVYYRDGTVSDWQDYNVNLPNVVIDDLEIQYSIGQIRVATYGRGIWESPVELGSAVTVKSATKDLPGEFMLQQNHPNPFNPSTTFTYELPNSSVVRLSVYDMLGREVSTLVNGDQDAGYHEVRFDGSNLPTGVYFYRMQAGSYVETKKLLLIR
jgi:photosystem II stability/assembly factor-like uncharacterized protein